MMSDYIKMWLKIIETMNNDNTYKLAWGKALIEIAVEKDYTEKQVTISFEKIALKMLKYYWNQIFFFDLKQSPYHIPVIARKTDDCIKLYKSSFNSNVPIWFDYAYSSLKKDKYFQTIVSDIAKTLRNDVSWRFKNSQGEILDIYELDRKNMVVSMTIENIEEIKEYSDVLVQLLNYKWAELLEKFNNSPRIIAKVKGISDRKIKRGNLSPYKKILLNNIENKIAIDFYTGTTLKEKDISVDHVIPWTFMYSDDIWNLVLTSKSYNSKKFNHIPSQEVINRLLQRNLELANTIKNKKMQEELYNAIKNQYVEKFFLALKF